MTEKEDENRTLHLTKQRFSWSPWQHHGGTYTPDEAAKEQKRLENKGWTVTIR